MEDTHWAFNSGQRSPKDRSWFVGYVSTMICTGVMGLLAWHKMNPLFHRAIFDARFMNNPDSCDAHFPGRRLLNDDDDFEKAFAEIVIAAILYSIIPALVAGFGIIHLFRKAPHTMVTIGCWTPVAFFIVLTVLVSVNGLPEFAPMYLIPAGILVYIYFRHKSKLELVGRLMKVACDSLAANLNLVPFALGANFTAVPVLVAIGAVIYCLQGIGSVVPNPDAAEQRGGRVCLDVDGKPETCCVWKTEGWVLPAQIVVAIVLLWTDAIVAQLRTYIMGGVITQWYFHEEVRGTIPRSLRHALGPSRGTLCFSAAVVTVCNLIRSIADQIRSNRGNPVYLLISCLFAWLIDMLMELIKFISTLATIQASATGEAFLEAARSVGAMLTRHRLSAVSVWWVPNMVLGSLLLSVGLAGGTVAYFIADAMWQGSNRHDPTLDATILGIIVGYAFVLLTGWLLGFIRSATEVVYVCFARDLDNRAVTRPDVHAVLKDLPAASGAVVVQPDDNLMYGEMEAGSSPTAPLNPSMPEAPPARDLTAAIEAAPEQPPRKGDN